MRKKNSRLGFTPQRLFLHRKGILFNFSCPLYHSLHDYFMKATLCGALKLNGAKEEEDLLLRRVEALNKKMLEIVNESVENGEDIESREDEFKNISDEISRLNERISAIRKAAGQDVNARRRMEFIEKQLAKMKCMITEYYDFAETVVRQMVECVKVFDSGKVEVVFEGGYVVEEQV